jgi:hypothetical protein
MRRTRRAHAEHARRLSVVRPSRLAQCWGGPSAPGTGAHSRLGQLSSYAPSLPGSVGMRPMALTTATVIPE